MTSNYLTLTRQALYELVWSKPMIELAKEFGITDRGLAKRCQAVDVPVPPRGYWARLAAGQTPAPIPLPQYRGAPTANKQTEPIAEPVAPLEVMRDGPEPLIGFSLHPRPPKENMEAARSPEEVALRARIDAIAIPPLRPLAQAVLAVKRTALRLKGARVKDLAFGRDERAGSIVNIHVSDERDVRALQLADCLITSAHQLGWNFDVDPLPEQARHSRWNPPPEPELLRPGRLTVEGELIRFKIDERMLQVPHVLTADELATKKRGFQIYPPKWDYEPSGELRVHLTDLDGRTFKTRKDGARRLLEEQILELLHDLLDYANREKRLLEQRRLREEQSRERERLERLAQERYEAQEKLIHELERQAGAWHRARFLRRYIAAARRTAGTTRVEATIGYEKVDFLEWADAFVDQLDPLSSAPRNSAMRGGDQCLYHGHEEKQLLDALIRLTGEEWQLANRPAADPA